MTYAIIGGGISGLSAAYYLQKTLPQSKILLIESSNRLGGWINSFKNENETLFEIGPRTLRAGEDAGANTLNLAESLNLQSKIISCSKDHISAKNRLIKVNDKLHILPNSKKTMIMKVPPFSKPLIFYFFKDLFAKRGIEEDESIFSFVERRLGSECATYLIDAMSRGIYAGSAKHLSAKYIFPVIYEFEKKHRSVILGIIKDIKNRELPDKETMCELVYRARREKWSVWTLQGGLHTLVKEMENHIQQNGEIEILKECNIDDISFKNNKVEMVSSKGSFVVDKAISSIPAYALKKVIHRSIPELHDVLDSIPYVTVAVVNLEYEGNIIKNPAFGYLVPSCEQNTKVLGVIYDSCVTQSDENKTVLTVMMGGYWFEELFGENPSEEHLLDVACKEISSTLETSKQPISSKVNILRNCIPQYTIGHSKRRDAVKEILKDSRLQVVGNYFGGVGVNDAIYNAKKLIKSKFNE